MKVIMAKSAGFCWGVRRAVETAVRTAEQVPHPVFTDGPIIHNPSMLAELARQGIERTDSPDLLAPGSTLIIRAHGIPPEHRAKLEALPISLVDATCPEVSRIHKNISSYVANGYTVIIHGDKGHAEVTGLLGHARGHGFVVETASDIDELPYCGKVCLVAQTTQFTEAFAEVAKRAKDKFAETVVLDTICRATKARQGELADLASQCGKIVVVGSRTSANSTRLAEIAQKLRPTILVQSADDIVTEDFINIEVVGVTAGASTPDKTINEVHDRLTEI